MKKFVRFTKDHLWEILLYPAILYAISFLFGLIYLWGDGGLVHIDEMNWVLNGHIIIAKDWIPYYNWQHTPLYSYFIGICIVLFGENYFLIHLVQNFFIASFPVIIYFILRYCLGDNQTGGQITNNYSIRVNKPTSFLPIPFLGGLLAATTFFSIFLAANLFIENLTFVFFALSLYLWHRYLTEAGTKSDNKNLFWAGVCTAITFNCKETSIVVYALPLLYILWQTRKTFTAQKVMVLLFVVILTIGPFALVQILTDFFFFRYYLALGSVLTTNLLDTLLNNLNLTGDLFFTYMPILAILGLLGSIWFIFTKIQKRSKNKAPSRFDNLAMLSLLSIVTYVVFLILRPGIQYMVLLLPPLVILATWFGVQIYHSIKALIEKREKPPNNRKSALRLGLLVGVIAGSQVAYSVYGFVVTKPVIYQSYDAWTQIANRVGNNATYLTIAVSDICFSNAYGPSTWHASYRRHGWETYSQEDLRELTNATLYEWEIKNIVIVEGAAVNDFVKNLTLYNATLVGAWSFQSVYTINYAFTPELTTISLYYINVF